MVLFVGISELALPHARALDRSPVACVRDAALRIEAGRVVAVGRAADLAAADADINLPDNFAKL